MSDFQMTQKVLTVFGATGHQGGSVIRAILSHPKLSKQYAIRAITREPSSPKAALLEKQGVEVVKANLNDPASVKEAVKGSNVVFAVTNTWDPECGAERETEQGKAIADAAAEAKADLLILSTLPGKDQIDAEAGVTSDIERVPHFESKAAVEQYVRTAHPELPAAFLHLSLFLDNYLGPPLGPAPDGEGDLALRGPFPPDQPRIPMCTPLDTGVYVAALLLADRPSVVGKQWFGVSSLLSPAELTAEYAAGTGKYVYYEQIPHAAFTEAINPAVRREMDANFKLIAHPGYFGSERAAREGMEAMRTLIAETGAGELTTPAAFYRAAFSV